ncbi:MAG: hypothetical protein R2864_00060 [Syntrophotaleaceae bacterium]
MAQNFRPSYIDKLWNVKSVKLPFSGASAHDLQITLKTALRTGKVQRVLFGLDVFSFTGAPTRLSNGPGSIPLYLYDDKILNDIKYLLSIDTLLFYKYLIKANFTEKHSRYLDHDNYGYNGHTYEYSKNEVIKHWKKATFNKNFLKEDFESITLINSFNTNLLEIIKENPNVKFDIFFPPYSILTWIDSKEKGLVKEFLVFKSYVVHKTSDLSNVRVFDFQMNERIILDFDNYKDISHYSPLINDFIIESISKGLFLSSQKIYDDKLNEFMNLINDQANNYPR